MAARSTCIAGSTTRALNVITRAAVVVDASTKVAQSILGSPNPRTMRIRVIQTPTESCIDGLDLSRYKPGREYDVGSLVGALLLAERWAEPLPFDDPGAQKPGGEIAARTNVPVPNLIREIFPTHYHAPP